MNLVLTEVGIAPARYDVRVFIRVPLPRNWEDQFRVFAQFRKLRGILQPLATPQAPALTPPPAQDSLEHFQKSMNPRSVQGAWSHSDCATWSKFTEFLSLGFLTYRRIIRRIKAPGSPVWHREGITNAGSHPQGPFMSSHSGSQSPIGDQDKREEELQVSIADEHRC